MKPITLTVLIVFCAVLGSVLGAAIYINWDVISADDVQRVDYVFSVQPESGFDVATDRLRLGAVGPGGTARREITLDAFGTWMVEARFRGDGAQYLRMEPSATEFQDNVTFTVELKPPVGTPYGLYEGEVVFLLEQVNK